MRPWWKWLLASVLLLALVAVAVLRFRPFWLIDAASNYYLRTHGVKHRFARVDGYNIHYLEAAPAMGPEKPLLLIHGLGARATDWTPMIPTLAQHGYHVYALDLLGYGESPKPAGGDFSLAAEERLTVDFLQALHIPRADVGGWSMGGWIAMKLALDHPEIVRRLMVYDSAGLYFVVDFPPTLFAPQDRAGFERLLDRIESDHRRIHIPAISVPGFIRRFQQNRWIVEDSYRSMLTGREILDFRVHALKMPLLIVWGTEDHLTPLATGLRLHELVPQSEFVGIRGCGHLAAAECAPQALDATIGFLDAEPPRAPSTQYVDGPR